MSKQKYSLWQTVFTVMVLVPLFLGRGHAIDPAHARASALFRLSMILIGIVGLLVTWGLTRRSSKQEAMLTEGQPADIVISECSSIPEGDVIEWSVNDRSTRADFWRCNLYVLTHRGPTVVMILAVPLLFSCIFGLPFATAQPDIAITIALSTFAAWFVFLAVISYLDMLKRYPLSSSERILTTTLTHMGFEDVTPEKSVFVPWNRVSGIRERGGDVYLWRAEGKGNYVTRNAFANVQEARAFVQTATKLWKNPMPLRLSETPGTAYQPTVWPPPPRV